ncbi:hypothetical protein [Flavobacterium sp.]|jgi:hypothetical protein|uniref:hypothetical protein n=1 Tax=Flavobacterium sp. TaxID=239 RepID=UPI0026380D9E|nr:hypothetical protein [Flavobacterium sp.]
MASHYPIETKGEHIALVKELLDRIKSLNFFTKIERAKGGHFIRLDERYEMNEYHGKVDKEIFSYTSPNGEILEIHLDDDNKINQVYEVL